VQAYYEVRRDKVPEIGRSNGTIVTRVYRGFTCGESLRDSFVKGKPTQSYSLCDEELNLTREYVKNSSRVILHSLCNE